MDKNLSNTFQIVSKEDWLAKIEADLKGKSLESMNWQIGEGLEVSPFATEEDLAGVDNSILKEYLPDWQVGEIFQIKDCKESNKMVLDALMNGVNAPVFHFLHLPSKEEFAVLFEGIGVEFISCHFSFSEGVPAIQVYELWRSLLTERGLQSTFACFDFEDVTDKQDLLRIVAQNTDYSFETVHVNGAKFYSGDEKVIEELDAIMAKAKESMQQLIDVGIDAYLIAQQMYVTVAVGKSYLLQIAKLRALKLRWVALLKEFNVAPSLPFLKVVFAEEAYGEDEHDNLINASTLAMSAVCGGASHLVVKPTSTDSNAIRHARNVQLILKHESGFDKVADPASGSYFIEVLTNKLK